MEKQKPSVLLFSGRVSPFSHPQLTARFGRFFAFWEKWFIIKTKMNPDEYYTYEDRAYVSPTVSRDEQLGFVDNLRNVVSGNRALINDQTQRLGTNISPNLGGLTGADSYFAQRYQTTPIEAQVNTLKATAQAKALNDLLTNYQNQVTNRYNQAYRSYNKRSGGSGVRGTYKSYSGGTGGSNGTDDNNNASGWDGDMIKTIKDPTYVDTIQVPYKNPVRAYIDNSASVDNATAAKLGTGYNGQLSTYGGVQYVWANGANGPRWYRVKITGPVTGSN